jgi:hypothetical protein
MNTCGQRSWHDITGYAGADKINAARYKYICDNYDIYEVDRECTAAAVKLYDMYASNYGLKEGEALTREILKNCYVEIRSDLIFIGEKYVIARNYAKAAYGDAIGYDGGIEWGVVYFIYDLETGNEIMFNDILIEDWRGYCDWYEGKCISYTDGNTPIKTPVSKLKLINAVLRSYMSDKYIYNFINEDGSAVTALTEDNLFKR